MRTAKPGESNGLIYRNVRRRMNAISILEGAMVRKILALFVLFAFLVFDWSCVAYSIKQVSAPQLTALGTQGIVIEKLLMKSGKIIEFTEERPPVVGRDYVVGVRTGEERRTKKIQRADVKEFIINSNGRKQAAIMADGSAYWIISMAEDASGVLTVEYFPDAYAVPISDIESFQVRMMMADTRVDTGKKNRGAIVVVTKKDGDWARGELLAVKPNGLVVSISETPTGESVSIAIEDIDNVIVVKKLKVGDSILLGGLAGAGLFGGITAFSAKEEYSWLFGTITVGTQVFWAAFSGLLAGILVGAIVGAAISANKTFRFDLSKEERDSALLKLSEYAAIKGVR
jgi:hypothetical protein